MIIGNFAINFVSIISCILLISVILSDKPHLKLNIKELTIFLSVVLLLFINLIYSESLIFSVKKIFGLIKYIILSAAIFYCCLHSEKFYLTFLKIIFFTVLFVSVDSLIQYFFYYDIFGFETKLFLNQNNEIIHKRLTGPFGNELVPGSFIAKFGFLSLTLLSIKKKNTLTYFFLFFYILVIFLTGERSAFIMIIFTSLIFIILCNKSYLIKILLILTLIIFFTFMFQNNRNTLNHYKNFNLTKSSETISIINNFQDTQWGAHYLTAIEIFKENIFFGSGLGSFRFKCSDKSYDNINSKLKYARCSSHPHNIYLEILSETGIFIFFLFIFLNIKIFYSLFREIFFKKNELGLLLFCNYIVLFNPFQTTGSFFSTWTGIFYWIFLSYFFFFKKKYFDK